MCRLEKIDNYKNLHHPLTKTSVETVAEKINYNCKEGNEFWFYNNLETNNKPLIYEHLLKSANYKVYVWDPHINPNDAKLFELINTDVEIKCLTVYESYKKDANRIKNLFKDNLTRIQEDKKYTLKVKMYNIPKGQKGFHDRYLFIDENIYIIGSSMAYHNTQSTSKAASTSIHKITSECNKKIITDMFWKYWNNEKSEEVLNLYEKTPENE